MRVFLGIVLVLAAATVHAQDATTSFDQLPQLLRQGETVTVTAASGTVLKGRVVDVSPSALALSVHGQLREYAADDVLKITRTRTASIGKGAAWGAGIGAGFFGILGVMAGGSDCAECLTRQVLMSTGISAGIGAGFAALSISEHLLFVKPSRSVRLNVAPAISASRKGVLLTASW